MISRREFQAIDDALYTGGVFNGYDVLGYIGNGSRSYVTDAWVLEGANKLGWSVEYLTAWLQSKCGRWLLDAQPMSAAETLHETRAAERFPRLVVS